MPTPTIRNLFLITCIAGVAAAAAGFGHPEKAGIRAPAREASATAPQMCAAGIRTMASPAKQYRSRYLAQTPVSYIARRGR